MLRHSTSIWPHSIVSNNVYQFRRAHRIHTIATRVISFSRYCFFFFSLSRSLPIKLIHLWNIDNNNKSIVIYLIFIIAIFVIGYRNHLLHARIFFLLLCLFLSLAATEWMDGCMCVCGVYLFVSRFTFTTQINCSLFMHGGCLLFVSIFHLFVVQIVKYFPFCSVVFPIYFCFYLENLKRYARVRISLSVRLFFCSFSHRDFVLFVVVIIIVCVCVFFFSFTAIGFVAYRFLLFHYLCSFIACE